VLRGRGGREEGVTRCEYLAFFLKFFIERDVGVVVLFGESEGEKKRRILTTRRKWRFSRRRV
jgi:tRNA pseudouridine-54 N-methylase